MTITSRKVCVVTGTRAEYGLLRWVMQGIQDSELLELQLIVTGMHLSPEFGLTSSEIESDGFTINRKVEMLLSSDTPVGIIKSMGLSMIGFADALVELNPDLLLVLGDRYEIFAAASAAMISNIPIAHCHGGETTEGAYDEAIRHSITKMSHLHFVAADEYRQRVIQLGECPEQVFNVGGLGIDNINKLNLMSRDDLEDSLGFKLLKRNLLITFHPVTLESDCSAEQMSSLLDALSDLSDTGLIFTMPNADTGSRLLFQLINTFCSQHINSRVYTSLGQIRYLSCVAHVDGVIGNSSSGILEVPSLSKGTINIGDRQKGRIQASSIINSASDYDSITKALETLFSSSFQESLKFVSNPYGTGGASCAIVKVLEDPYLNLRLKKTFYDLAL